MKYHLMFEQSGTFKKEFKSLGYEAYDYDILNDFEQTDYQMDLFHEIEEGYTGGASIFDSIEKEDVIMAFFPCIRFEDQIIMSMKGRNAGMRDWDMVKKLNYAMKLNTELNEMYGLISKLVVICLKKHLQLVIENPYSTQHYLTRYWCLKPKLIDYDRSERGDYYEKPTQYWFINCEPKNNFILEPQCIQPKRKVSEESKVERSMISPQYANRFIREFLIDERSKDEN